MYKLLFCFLLPMLVLNLKPHAQESDINRDAFYKAMKSSDSTLIKRELRKKALSSSANPAFRGALLMKKAGLPGAVSEKVRVFREGRDLLESAIARDTSNTEYRFLRIMIQERAPKILGYRQHIGRDCDHINRNLSKLTPQLQAQIRDYSKNSKVLTALPQ